MLEWVALPFSRGSSQPRDPTPVFCVAESLPAKSPKEDFRSSVKWAISGIWFNDNVNKFKTAKQNPARLCLFLIYFVGAGAWG